MSLSKQLAALPSDLLKRLLERGFDEQRLLHWSSIVGTDRDQHNRLTGQVDPPDPTDIDDAPQEGTDSYSRFRQIGLDALHRGEVAFCVLAGGMATRMGGVVKALVEALPGKTFLDLRLAENESFERNHGAIVPLWLMTSEATNNPIRAALGSRLDGYRYATFEQCVSVRLTPEGQLFLDDTGSASVYATGHGDLPDALRRAGLLSRFIAEGGKTVWITNLDNLGASVDPAILGWHLDHQGPLSVEVVDKMPGDKGGGPIRWNGKRIIVEQFRLPKDFDPNTVPVFNTNTFIVSTSALQNLELDWTYVEVEKKAGDRTAIQFERLLGELTVALEPRFLRVSRTGITSRFLPAKDMAELEQRRPEIEAIITARGFVV